MMRKLYLALLLCLFLVSPAHAIEVQRVISKGGIEAWLIEDHTLPILSINFSFDGGSALDPAAKPGVADFTASMLDEGAGKYSAEAFQEKLIDLAASIRFGADDDYFSGSLRTLSKNRDAVFDLMRAALTEPAFSKTSMERVRGQLIAGLRQSENDPDYIAGKLWWETIFPGHSYGRHETMASIAAITADDLRHYAQRNFGRDRLKIGVAGDITKADLAVALDYIFGALPQRTDTLPANPFVEQSYGLLKIHAMKQPQTVAYFGHTSIKRNDPDFYPAYVLNHVLGGGGFTSRLTKKVRDENGLAYSIYTSLDTRKETGIIMGYVATQKDRIDDSMNYIRAIWAGLANDITADEVEQAKKFLIGSFPLRFQSTPQIAAILVGLQQENLGIDFFDRRNDLVRAVTYDDVKRVAKTILQPDKLLFTVVGDYQEKKE